MRSAPKRSAMYWKAVPFTAVHSSTSRCLKIQDGRLSIGRSLMLMMLSKAPVVMLGHSGISSQSTT